MAQRLQILGRQLLTGSAAAQLWFIPVLLQLYLLYPALKRLMRRFPRAVLAGSFLISMLCTIAVYIPGDDPGWLRLRLWRLFPTWQFFFVLGMAASGERWEQLRCAMKKYAPLLCLLTVCAALAYAWASLRSGKLESVKPQLFIYGPLCFLGIAASWECFRRIPGLTALSDYVARHSMTVFFAHGFFLIVLRRIDWFNTGSGAMLMSFAAALLLSCLVALLPELFLRYRRRGT